MDRKNQFYYLLSWMIHSLFLKDIQVSDYSSSFLLLKFSVLLDASRSITYCWCSFFTSLFQACFVLLQIPFCIRVLVVLQIILVLHFFNLRTLSFISQLSATHKFTFILINSKSLGSTKYRTFRILLKHSSSFS